MKRRPAFWMAFEPARKELGYRETARRAIGERAGVEHLVDREHAPHLIHVLAAADRSLLEAIRGEGRGDVVFGQLRAQPGMPGHDVEFEPPEA